LALEDRVLIVLAFWAKFLNQTHIDKGCGLYPVKDTETLAWEIVKYSS